MSEIICDFATLPNGVYLPTPIERLEAALQEIDAWPVQRVFARVILHQAGLEHALATVRGWKGERPDD